MVKLNHFLHSFIDACISDTSWYQTQGRWISKSVSIYCFFHSHRDITMVHLNILLSSLPSAILQTIISYQGYLNTVCKLICYFEKSVKFYQVEQLFQQMYICKYYIYIHMYMHISEKVSQTRAIRLLVG